MQITSRIIKGGALLEESRRFVEAWNPAESTLSNIEQIRHMNFLGKASRSRSADVLAILRQRFVDPGPDVIATLRQFLEAARTLREAFYYEASRNDALLAMFAEGPVFSWYGEGRPQLGTEETTAWVRRLPTRWGEETTNRVVQGLLSTLRDFGVLEGEVRKRFAPAHMTTLGFAYVALRERENQPSSRALYEAAVWRRYLLDRQRVRELFVDADHHKFLRFSEVGSAIRIDWLIASIQELPRVLAA